MADFALDYLGFVFLSAVGVLLVVAAYNRLDGLLFVGRRLSLLAGGLLIVGAFAWFFTSKARNVPDTGAGLDGNEQALLFIAGAGAALVLVLLLSSLRNWSMVGNPEKRGLEALRHSSYLRILFRELWSRWNSLYRRMRERSSG